MTYGITGPSRSGYSTSCLGFCRNTWRHSLISRRYSGKRCYPSTRSSGGPTGAGARAPNYYGSENGYRRSARGYRSTRRTYVKIRVGVTRPARNRTRITPSVFGGTASTTGYRGTAFCSRSTNGATTFSLTGRSNNRHGQGRSAATRAAITLGIASRSRSTNSFYAASIVAWWA